VHKAALLIVLAGSVAYARPQEAIDADRAAADAELVDLARRASSLDEQIALRRRMLRQRVRALYKLTQGGALRLVVEAANPLEIAQRIAGASRVIGRDLREIGALGDEMSELDRDRALRASEEQRVTTLEQSPHGVPVGLEVRRGQLPRPVPGPIVVGLSHTRVQPAGSGVPAIELPRRAVELASTPGEPVRAVANGTVRFVGPIDGLGEVVVIDHGDRYATLTGRLRAPEVAIGARVNEGQAIGRADATTVTFELSESRTALDPARWMRPPLAPHAVGPTHADASPDHRAPL